MILLRVELLAPFGVGRRDLFHGREYGADCAALQWGNGGCGGLRSVTESYEGYGVE